MCFVCKELEGDSAEAMMRPKGAEVHMPLTKRHYFMGGGAAVLAAALTLSAATSRDASYSASLPEHTVIHVTLDQALSSNHSRPGDRFYATVSQDVVVDGRTVIPQGSHA